MATVKKFEDLDIWQQAGMICQNANSNYEFKNKLRFKRSD
jgi:hypothetical protein